jgi:hypothetical protein
MRVCRSLLSGRTDPHPAGTGDHWRVSIPGAKGSRAVTAHDTGIDLYWVPLGAGGHSVRLNGRVFEAVAAGLERRRACDLHHSALEVRAT